MLLNIISWDGHNLNDSNYASWFAVGQPLGPGADPQYSPRSRTFPKLSAMDIGSTKIELHIQTKGTIHSQLKELQAWFNVFDLTSKALVAKDTADGNRQWYVMARPASAVTVSESGAGEYVVTLAVDEPLWRTAVKATDSLAVTASGQSKALTVLGNYYARPKITITINSLKNSSYKTTLWKPWYNPMTNRVNDKPFDFTNGGINTTNLIADATVSNQINQGGGISAAATSIPIDTAVGGGLPTTGGMCYVDSEQIYYTSISGGIMTVYDDGAGTTGRGWGGTTAAAHADNAVLTKSHILANLNDVRLFDGENEIARWTGSVGAATKIWTAVRFQPAVTMTLNAAMGTGAVTTVAVQRTAANQTALGKLPRQFMAIIDNEVFYCKDPNPSAYRFRVIARAQKGTTAATHAAGATVRWLDHDLTLAYGNPLASAPAQDDSVKPIFDLDASTNTSLVYTELKSLDGLRAGGWQDTITVRSSPNEDGYSRIYTATQNGDADPATDLGFAAKAFYQSGAWRAENFTGSISLYHPAGFTTITLTGYKRREAAGWMTFKFQKSRNGTAWTDAFTEASPAAAGSWTALASHSGVSLGGSYPFIRWYATGSVTAAANNANYLEFAGGTYALSSANVPKVAFSTSANNAYFLDATISINETGEEIRLIGATKTGSVAVVDCDAETVTLDGREGGIAVSWNSVRDDWLNLPSPQQSATCTLVYTETGVTSVTVGVEWENRSTL